MPILILHLFMFLFYKPDKGDLLRMGYLIDLYPNYRTIFNNEFNKPINFTKITDKPSKKQFKIFTIGDSFSEQKNYGYKNYIADSGISVLHYDRSLHKNQIETLYNLLNGNFFEKFTFEYLILEIIERDVIELVEIIDTTKILSYVDVKLLAQQEKPLEDHSYKFPSNRLFKFYYSTIQYYLNDDYLFHNKVYKTKINEALFSTDKKELLFYHGDVNSTKKNNKLENVLKINNLLNNIDNKLSKKGIKLIVLIAPNKYTVYYPYITHQENFPKPEFFQLFGEMKKTYTSIDALSIFSNNITRKKDLYFYDDSHWSPWASQLVAKEIKKELILTKEQ